MKVDKYFYMIIHCNYCRDGVGAQKNNPTVSSVKGAPRQLVGFCNYYFENCPHQSPNSCHISEDSRTRHASCSVKSASQYAVWLLDFLVRVGNRETKLCCSKALLLSILSKFHDLNNYLYLLPFRCHRIDCWMTCYLTVFDWKSQ